MFIYMTLWVLSQYYLLCCLNWNSFGHWEPIGSCVILIYSGHFSRTSLLSCQKMFQACLVFFPSHLCYQSSLWKALDSFANEWGGKCAHCFWSFTSLRLPQQGSKKISHIELHTFTFISVSIYCNPWVYNDMSNSSPTPQARFILVYFFPYL